jgi:hypothetical protein
MAVDINGDGLIALGGTSTTQGRVRLAEDTDNGTNYVELTANAAVTTNRTVTFPDADINFTTGLSATLGGTGITSAGTSGNVLTSNGTAWVSQAISAGGDYVMQIYTTPATWTKPAAIKAVKVTIVGGGGAGGGTAHPAGSKAGGGGAGGAGILYLDAPAIPGPITVTVGTGGTGGTSTGPSGGTSSFGPLLSATGGAGGGAPAGGTGTGGAGGTVSTPGVTLLASGGAGSAGYAGDCLNPQMGGAGGSLASSAPTIFNLNTNFYNSMPQVSNYAGINSQGGPGLRQPAPISVAGIPGSGYGAGGGGALANAAPLKNGGNGTGGIIIVEEFY